MARYTKKIVNRIVELIELDSYTVKEICEDVGIHKDTYYDWLKNKPDFSDAVERAQQKFIDNILPEAKKSLKKLVKGYTVTETKTVTADTGKKNEETGAPIVKVKEHTKTEKHIQPNANMVAFTLTNLEPENWKHRTDSKVDMKAKVKGSVPITAWLKKNKLPNTDEE